MWDPTHNEGFHRFFLSFSHQNAHNRRFGQDGPSHNESFHSHIFLQRRISPTATLVSKLGLAPTGYCGFLFKIPLLFPDTAVWYLRFKIGTTCIFMGKEQL